MLPAPAAEGSSNPVLLLSATRCSRNNRLGRALLEQEPEDSLRRSDSSTSATSNSSGWCLPVKNSPRMHGFQRYARAVGLEGRMAHGTAQDEAVTGCQPRHNSILGTIRSGSCGHYNAASGNPYAALPRLPGWPVHSHHHQRLVFCCQPPDLALSSTALHTHLRKMPTTRLHRELASSSHSRRAGIRAPSPSSRDTSNV